MNSEAVDVFVIMPFASEFDDVYKAIKEGRLRIRKYGTRTIVTRADLLSFLETLPDVPERDGKSDGLAEVPKP